MGQVSTTTTTTSDVRRVLLLREPLKRGRLALHLKYVPGNEPRYRSSVLSIYQSYPCHFRAFSALLRDRLSRLDWQKKKKKKNRLFSSSFTRGREKCLKRRLSKGTRIVRLMMKIRQNRSARLQLVSEKQNEKKKRKKTPAACKREIVYIAWGHSGKKLDKARNACVPARHTAVIAVSRHPTRRIVLVYGRARSGSRKTRFRSIFCASEKRTKGEPRERILRGRIVTRSSVEYYLE